MSQADLGRRLGLDRNDITEIVGRLASGRHVDRRPDPADRRRNVVSISPLGRQYLDDLERIAHEVQNELLQGLDDDDRAALAALLDGVLSSHGRQSS